MLGATLLGDPDVLLSGVAGLNEATPTDLTFIRDAQYATQWGDSRAGAAIVTRGLEDAIKPREGSALIVVDNADRSMMQLLQALAPTPVIPESGVHPESSIHPDASVHDSAHIGAHATVGPASTIGLGTVLHPGVRIGANVSLGDNVVCYPNVVVYDNCTIKNNVTLHAGAVIGAEGFGYHPTPDGSGVTKIPHIGAVRIEDGVEIGANTCIDRGKFSDTVIGRSTMIDNLVQIGHGCVIGDNCMLCGQVALAGSVVVGNGVTMGGGAAVADNIRIGDGARVGARSGVMSDISPGETCFGLPALPNKEYLALIARARKLPQTIKRLESHLQSRDQDG
jgi:UDP-3-O-[3-hydroxymyristoyl] glucosamine N-acyltransferase